MENAPQWVAKLCHLSAGNPFQRGGKTNPNVAKVFDTDQTTFR